MQEEEFAEAIMNISNLAEEILINNPDTTTGELFQELSIKLITLD